MIILLAEAETDRDHKGKNSERVGRKTMAFILGDQGRNRTARKRTVETEIKISPPIPVIKLL